MLEYIADDSSVVGEVLRKDEDVIEVHIYRPFHDKVPEYVVHHSLEGGWAVCETAEHYHQFKQPSVGPKGTFPLITLMNANIVVPPANIQLGEIFGSSVVLHQLEGAIFLLNEEYQGCHW